MEDTNIGAASSTRFWCRLNGLAQESLGHGAWGIGVTPSRTGDSSQISTYDRMLRRGVWGLLPDRVDSCPPCDKDVVSSRSTTKAS
ncbi:hypothetical protein PoB_006302300 [Plakobranchus ocellatus]|uniref:Uncharacterized protein n=1 Tax=Plakobranchus ocellatus TaxID=259542 RepID=A0AAV4CXD9_9GAST|nr:hypothetical protein PoB_006302300 [Plakobranchus ocellatus]